MKKAQNVADAPELPEAEALNEPSEGTPDVIDDPDALRRACDAIAAGSGSIAVDTERASGYRYWPKAYLIQLRRAGAGTHLVDPIALRGELDPLVETLNGTHWVLHAASQDLPCLGELDLRPARLFDTELAGRLAGFDRVALGTLVERLLGYRLEKGHSAADWSTRPLPTDWLNYAALDVELLLPLRDSLAEELEAQGKLEWAMQEFEAVRTAGPSAPRAEPWRRTSGIHKIRSPRNLAIARALWEARDQIARQRDRAPSRILPDNAIVAAATTPPKTVDELRALPVFGGRMQRRLSSTWLQHIQEAQRLSASDLPVASPNNGGPPAPNRWADRDPDAAARLSAARTGLTELAKSRRIPAENLLLPDLVRRLCWQPPADRRVAAVGETLRENGARPWQIDLTAELLATALQQTA